MLEAILCGITLRFHADFSPQASLARHLSTSGFDTWILEVRGAGLSKREGEPTSSELGGTDGALSGAVQDAFVQATIKNATKATEIKMDGAAKHEQKEATEEHQSNGHVKSDKTSEATDGLVKSDEDTVTSRMTNRIAQISETLRSLVSEGQSRILVAKYIEQVLPFCT